MCAAYSGLQPQGTLNGRVTYLFNQAGTHTFSVFGVRGARVDMMGNGGPGGFASNQAHSGGGGGGGARALWSPETQDPIMGDITVIIPEPVRPDESPYTARKTRVLLDGVEVASAASGGGGAYISNPGWVQASATGGGVSGPALFGGEASPGDPPPNSDASSMGGNSGYDGIGGQGTYGTPGGQTTYPGGQGTRGVGGAGVFVEDLATLINGGRVGGGGAAGANHPNSPPTVDGGAAAEGAVPGTGGGGRGWSDGNHAHTSATAGATGYVLFTFTGDVPPLPPPTITLQNLYTARVENFAGSTLMAAVHTAVTDVDGVAPTALHPLSNVAGDFVRVQTPQMFMPRSVVDVTTAPARDVPRHVYDACVHAANPTKRGVCVVHVRAGAGQVAQLTFNRGVTPLDETSPYFTVSPAGRASSFTVTMGAVQPRDGSVHRLGFTGFNGQLVAATVGGQSVLHGMMHPGVFTTAEAEPEVLIIGHIPQRLTLRAAQDLTLSVDGGAGGVTAVPAGGTVPWPGVHSSLRVTQCGNPYAELVTAESSVGGVTRVTPVNHVPLAELQPNDAVDVARVHTAGGMFADVATTELPGVFARVGTDPAYAPAHRMTHTDTLVSAINAALSAPNVQVHPADVVVDRGAARVHGGAAVRSAWTPQLMDGDVLPDGVARLTSVDALSRTMRLNAPVRPLRVLHNRDHGVAVQTGDRLRFTTVFHGDTVVGYTTTSGQARTVDASPVKFPRRFNVASFDYAEVDGVRGTSVAVASAGTTVLIEARDRVSTFTITDSSRVDTAHAAEAVTVNDPGAARAALTPATAPHDAAYSASAHPIVSSAALAQGYDAWHVGGTILAWSVAARFVRVHAAAPVALLPLTADGAEYVVLGMLGYDTARVPAGKVDVSTPTVCNDASALFRATCTSPLPALLLLRPSDAGTAVTTGFADGADGAAGALEPDDIAAVDGRLPTFGPTAPATAASVLPPGASVAFGVQGALTAGALSVADVAAAATGALRGQVVVAGAEPFPTLRLARVHFNVPPAPSGKTSRVWASDTRTAVILAARRALSRVLYVTESAAVTAESGVLLHGDGAADVAGVLLDRQATDGATLFTDPSAAPGAAGPAWILVPHAGAETMRSPDEMVVLASYAGGAQMQVTCPTPCVVTWTAAAPNVPFTYDHPGVVSGAATPVTVGGDNGFVLEAGTCVLDTYVVSTAAAAGQAAPPVTSRVPFYTTARRTPDVSVEEYIAPTAEHAVGVLPVTAGGILHDWWEDGMAHAPVPDAVGVSSRNATGRTRFVPALYRAGGVPGAGAGNVVRSGALEYVYTQAPPAHAAQERSAAWAAEYDAGPLRAGVEHLRITPRDRVLVLAPQCALLDAEPPVYSVPGVAAVYKLRDMRTLRAAPAELPLSPLDALFPVHAVLSTGAAVDLAGALSPTRQPPTAMDVAPHGKPSTMLRVSMSVPGAAGAAGVFDPAAPDTPSTLAPASLLGLEPRTGLKAFIAAPRAFDAALNTLPATPRAGSSVVIGADAAVSAAAATHTLHSDGAGGVTQRWIVDGCADGTWAVVPLAHAVCVTRCAAVDMGAIAATGVRAGSSETHALTRREVGAGAALAQALTAAAALAYDVVDGGVRFQGSDDTELAAAVSQTLLARIRNVEVVPVAVFAPVTRRVPASAGVYAFSTGVPVDTALPDNPTSAAGPEVDAVALGALCAAVLPVRVLDVEGGWGAPPRQAPGQAVPVPLPVVDAGNTSQVEADTARKAVLPKRAAPSRVTLSGAPPSLGADMRWIIIQRLLKRRDVSQISSGRELAAFVAVNVPRENVTLRLVLSVFAMYRQRPPSAILARARGRQSRFLYESNVFDLL